MKRKHKYDADVFKHRPIFSEINITETNFKTLIISVIIGVYFKFYLKYERYKEFTAIASVLY